MNSIFERLLAGRFSWLVIIALVLGVPAAVVIPLGTTLGWS